MVEEKYRANQDNVAIPAKLGPMTGDQLLTTAQLAKALGISRRSLSRYAADGVLVPELTTPGGHYRWNEVKARTQLQILAERQKRS